MNTNRSFFIIGGGCILLLLLVVVALSLLLTTSLFEVQRTVTDAGWTFTPVPEEEVVAPLPTLTVVPGGAGIQARTPLETMPQVQGGEPGTLNTLYEQLNPGVVNIQVYVERGPQVGQGAGSGFILDDQGHIITNNHVIVGAEEVTVIFYNGLEVDARVIGTDPDSDLAVLRVDQLPEGTHSLPLGDSNQVRVGDWVVAIGNPFQLGGSMTVGVVSAIGRTIPSGATPFAIPQAIQTDAAINPGNSGGPLITLNGEVIGVNAQILTGGPLANAGVGFAIPSNVVRRVAPTLIQEGVYSWPWLGAQGGSVNLAIMEANDLETQFGAYVQEVVPGSPADEAGLRGSVAVEEVAGIPVPIGGDVIIEADGQPVVDFADLLARIAEKAPGDQMTLTVLRDGQREQVTVTLEPRPANFGP